MSFGLGDDAEGLPFAQLTGQGVTGSCTGEPVLFEDLAGGL